MTTKADKLQFLNQCIDEQEAIPSWFKTLDDQQLDELCAYMDHASGKQMHAVDNMMNSMAQSMKYIPNMFLQMMAKKYVEPNLSARLTQKMSMKQVVGLTKGMPIDYIGEVAACQSDNAYAAEIMAQMKKKDMEPIIKYMCEKHPVKSIDIAAHMNNDLVALAAKYMTGIPSEYMTPEREQTLSRMGK